MTRVMEQYHMEVKKEGSKTFFIAVVLLGGFFMPTFFVLAQNEYGSCDYGNESYQANCPPETGSTGGGIIQRLAPVKASIPVGTTQNPATPSATPATIPVVLFTRYLKLGMEGADVKSLQELLNKKGFTVTTSGPGSPGNETTRFGKATQSALAKLQAANQISPALGYIGPKTLETLNSLVSSGASTESPSTPAAEFVFSKDLSPGVTHEDVKKLQQFLNANGYPVALSGVGSKGQETNYFGPATKQAIIKFQEAYASEILTPSGLTAGNGRLGPKTREKINSLMNIWN